MINCIAIYRCQKVGERFQKYAVNFLLEALQICERSLDQPVFPQMTLVEGALSSVNGDVDIDPEIPSHPLVQP